MRTFRLIEMTLLMVLCAVNFTACSDDEDEPFHLDSITGTWYSSYFNSHSYQEAAIDLQLNDDNTGYIGYIDHYNIDGEVIYYAKENITYSYDGNSSLVINFLEQGYSYNFELYFIKGGNGTPIRMCAKEKNSSEEYIFEKSK